MFKAFVIGTYRYLLTVLDRFRSSFKYFRQKGIGKRIAINIFPLFMNVPTQYPMIDPYVHF